MLAGKLTAASLCQTIAALQPEGCVLVDESLTSGGSYWDASKARTHPSPARPLALSPTIHNKSNYLM
jgi:hypothetical protein